MNSAMVAPLREVEVAQNRFLLLDARVPERYRGDSEPVDVRAGHIHGAVNAPWKDNMTDAPVPAFKDADTLRQRWQTMGLENGQNVICYCGSGVTACHNLLALEIAGLHGARLYPGSWSEWVATHLE